jgi:hypothetical protein
VNEMGKMRRLDWVVETESKVRGSNDHFTVLWSTCGIGGVVENLATTSSLVGSSKSQVAINMLGLLRSS